MRKFHAKRDIYRVDILYEHQIVRFVSKLTDSIFDSVTSRNFAITALYFNNT